MATLRYPSWPRYGVALRPGAVAVPLPLIWPAKAVTDVLDFGVDLTAWLADVSDQVDSAAWSAAPAGLVLGSAIGDPNRPGTWIVAGGTAGQVYSVTLSVGTAGGRQISVVCALPLVAVNGQAMPTAPTYLLDGSGNFILGPGGVPLSQG